MKAEYASRNVDTIMNFQCFFFMLVLMRNFPSHCKFTSNINNKVNVTSLTMYCVCVCVCVQNKELAAENAELPGLRDTVEELRYLEGKVVGAPT